ncbi:MAG: cytochrome b N-terminal domain-containing protein [Deltaproteobacteria bacterium]|nr:cytochrome b N-terminal domain-containing protein [Deltaproteobacteria bacterium]
MKKLRAWASSRAGTGGALRRLFDVPTPGGARWSRGFGTALLALFLVQAVTGLALMTVYTPSTQGAWSSTFHLQHTLPWGAWVRALHHHATHAVIVLVAVHLLAVVLRGGYRAPRELTWWSGLALVGLIVGFSMTGFPLAWDQWGYWASRIEMGITRTSPGIGPQLERALLGGHGHGQLSLTRFYTLHVAVLPLGLVALVLGHLALVRKHGLTPPARVPEGSEEARWWPGQAARDALWALLAVGAVYLAAQRFPAPLDAPADPTSHYPARPVWYFKPLSQLLHSFPASKQVLGSHILPGVLGAVFALFPFLDRRAEPRLRGRLHLVGLVLAVFLGAAGLGWRMDQKDRGDRAFQRATREAAHRAEVAHALAARGIPPEGPLEMVRLDPALYPKRLFAERCGVCHAVDRVSWERKGPTLDGFGGRRWAEAFMVFPDAPTLMGTTRIRGMPPQGRRLRRLEGDDGLRAVAEWLFTQGVEPGDRDTGDRALAERGGVIYHRRCTACHQGEGDTSGAEAGERGAPELDGWGSREWLRSQVLNPAHRRNYGDDNQMPSFRRELTARELEVILDFVRSLRGRQGPPVVEPPPPPPEPPPTPPTEP